MKESVKNHFFVEHKEALIKKLNLVNTNDDLIQLLNYIHLFLLENKFPFTKKQFYFYSNYRFKEKNYIHFEIPKKSGQKRQISAPVSVLKNIQKSIAVLLSSIFEVNEYSFGFVENKSIVDNANKHIGKNFVLNIDIENFFHSITSRHVAFALSRAPFNLSEDKKPIVEFIINLITYKHNFKNVLPQGAPTSPIISNIVCSQLDSNLSQFCIKHGITYTRYADDLTFSCNLNKLYLGSKVYDEIVAIINKNKFNVNKEKCRYQSNNFKQEVTGLIVNEKVNVHRKYIKKLRVILHLWEKYGYSKANEIFNNYYQQDKYLTEFQFISMKNVVKGKLEYLKMVKGVNDPTYNKLYQRYNLLIR